MDNPRLNGHSGPIQQNTAQLINHPVIKNLAALFSEAGFELYLVGGSVRDALLGRGHEDFDFATNATPVETLSVIRGFADNIWQVGMAFGTVAFSKAQTKLEVTTFREEVYPENSRRPEVKFAASIDSDLSRRDFTVNAMAIKIPDGAFIDPFQGLSHLAAGRLVTPIGPEQSFADDPLRMLRALRFMAALDLVPDEEIVRALAEMKERLNIVSKERLRDELSKLLTAPRPGAAVLAMVETGLAAFVIPELIELGKLRDPAHRHKDVLKHTLKVLENVPADLRLRLAALFHDIGKPQTKTVDQDGIHFFHHEVIGARIAAARLRALRYPAKEIEEVKALIKLHMRFHTYRLGWTDRAVRKYIRETGRDRLRALSVLVKADCTTQNRTLAEKYGRLIDELDKRIADLEAEEESAKIKPPLDGNEIMEFLGVKPGPLVGEVLAMLLEARLEGSVRTKAQAYELIRRWTGEKAK